jgi:HEAT repeat protein
MAKSSRIEDTLAKLKALEGLGSEVIAPELSKSLASKTNLVVAKSADLAAKAGARLLEPQLVEAFGRFMVNGSSTDKGCLARKAIANALYELECDSDAARDVHLAGVRCVQMEPVWGGSEDTAAELRGICALGLVRVAHRDVMEILVDLLADPNHQARILAARAVAYSEREEGALLLRLKILSGDREEEVTCECINALGRLSGVKSLDFIERLMDRVHPETIQDAAAMAIGQMRRPAALAILLKHWESSIFPDRRTVCRKRWNSSPT